MKNRINELLKEVEDFSAENLEQLEAFRIKFLSKKGWVPALFADFKTVAPEDRRLTGQLINTLKQAVQNKIANLKAKLEEQPGSQSIGLDLSLPASGPRGTRHPLFYCTE